MKRILIAALVLAGFNCAIAQEVPVLVTPQWLHDNLNDPKLVILQSNGMKFDYQEEHIAGARYLWPEWLAPNTPDGNMNLPDVKKATDVIESLGISNDSKVILCYVRGEIPSTARMFLTFEYFGMKGKVAMLNGGLDAWKKAGFPVTKEVPSFKPGKFKASIDPVVVDRQYVFSHLKTDGTTILDARPTGVYNGDPTGFPRDGHIAGAKSLPYTELYDATNTIKSSDILQNYFNPVTDNTKKEVVTYCFIGQTASVVYLAGRALGYPMKLYDGSAQEWTRYKELPMEVSEKKPETKP